MWAPSQSSLCRPGGSCCHSSCFQNFCLRNSTATVAGISPPGQHAWYRNIRSQEAPLIPVLPLLLAWGYEGCSGWHGHPSLFQARLPTGQTTWAVLRQKPGLAKYHSVREPGDQENCSLSLRRKLFRGQDLQPLPDRDDMKRSSSGPLSGHVGLHHFQSCWKDLRNDFSRLQTQFMCQEAVQHSFQQGPHRQWRGAGSIP